MKLWKKISLVCGVILVTIVAACSAVLFAQVKKKLLSVTYERAAEKQYDLMNSFEDLANRNFSEEDSEAVKRAFVYYCFSRYADADAVLMIDDETIYSESDILPADYLAPEENWIQQQFSGTVHGRHILIVGSVVRLTGFPDNRCVVYVVEDITPIYEDLARQLLQFVLIDVVSIAAGLLLIICMVRRFTEPLTELAGVASRIAAGNYGERASLRTADEVGMLSADFNRMAEAVEQHIQELTETAERQRMFIGSVTHEFKTPLTALLLKIDTLENTYMEEEERLAYLTDMEQQCRWLERMVQKLLKLITLRQEFVPEHTSVSQLFRQVEAAVSENLAARGIGLEIQCETESLFLDADLMQSVLVNLVENAARSSKSGQIVILSAYENILEIKDFGVGMRKEDLAHITEPFYMVDGSRSKKHGGAGLGLALVEEIVGAHGAELKIESAIGIGTTVRVCLKK